MKRLAVLLVVACLAGWAGRTAKAAPGQLRTERFGAPALAVGSSVYVPGGYSNRGMLGAIERFETTADQSERLDQPILPRYFHTGAVHDGKLYIAGGLTPIPSGGGVARVTTDTFEEYDPEEGGLRQLAKMPVPVARPGAAVVGDRLFVIGGSLEDGSRTGAVQIYDFGAGEWTRGADMPVAREGAVMEADGKIYVPGGYDGNLAMRDFQVYIAAEDRWETLPDLPVKLSANHGLVLDGQLYTFGDYEILDRTAVFDLASREWSLLELDYKPCRHQGLARVGDEVFVVGGNVTSSAPFLNYIQRYTADQLAAAPRKPWKPGAEKRPVLPVLPGAGLATFDLSGKPAPEIVMPLFDGDREFKLSSVTGRVVVLDFWSTRCGPCVRALPEMAGLAREFEDRKVVFVGVSLDPKSRREAVRSFLEDRDIPYPMGHGTSQLGKEYGVRAIPCIVVVDREGIVQGRLIGFSPTVKATLRMVIKKMLENQPAPMASGTSSHRTCGGGRTVTHARPAAPPPDPRFFRQKWKKPLEEPMSGFGHGRVDWRLPPRHIVMRAEDQLKILDAETGDLRHTFKLPAELTQDEQPVGIPSFCYLQTGENGVVVAYRTVYEVTETSPGRRSYRGVKVQWMAISEAGDILWTKEGDQNEWSGTGLYLLPVGPDQDYLVLGGWRKFAILDSRGREVYETEQGHTNNRHWLFRPGPADGTVEVLVAGTTSLACYEVAFPPNSPLDARFFKPQWRRSAAAMASLGQGAARLDVQIPKRHLLIRNGNRLEVLRADDGEPIGKFAISASWRAGADAGIETAYLRGAGQGRAVLLRTVTDQEADPPVAMALAALDTEGNELWRLDLKEASADVGLFALPAGPDQDLLLVQLWNRLLFIEDDGTLLLEQPMGISADPWLVRPTADGDSFEWIELGDEIVSYRWSRPE